MLPCGLRVFVGLVKEAEGNQDPCGWDSAWQAIEMVREEALILPLSCDFSS